MSATSRTGPTYDSPANAGDLQNRIPAATGAYPVRPGNLVRPRLDGVPAFRPIAEAIGVARQSVWLTVAFCALDFNFPDGRGLFDVLDDAIARGLDVRVLLLVPAEPEEPVYAARREPARSALFEAIEALSHFETFMLAGLVVPDEERGRTIYVHAKTMLVDDVWATIGSCNLHANSLGGHAEMNASIWDENVVRALRCELLLEHLAGDTSDLNDSATMRLFREVAKANRRRAP